MVARAGRLPSRPRTLSAPRPVPGRSGGGEGSTRRRARRLRSEGFRRGSRRSDSPRGRGNPASRAGPSPPGSRRPAHPSVPAAPSGMCHHRRAPPSSEQPSGEPPQALGPQCAGSGAAAAGAGAVAPGGGKGRGPKGRRARLGQAIAEALLFAHHVVSRWAATTWCK